MPLTILVADDDLGTRLSISDYLELCGYSVVSAENGRKALEMVQQYQPHLVVTDITMPLMDGYELVRQVRRQPTFRLLPVIFLTARTNVEERIRAYQLGCDVYLPKPFELEELGAIVRNLLERSQLIESEWRLRVRPNDSEEPRLPDAIATQVALLTLDLTPREQEVLAVLVQGLSNIQIGERLHLSPRTVEKHVSSLLRKTDTNNRAELVRYAIEHHLVE
ncbi:response regulator transcription factor [Thermocoleostomius sinensis]|uniref:Response regulator transcription factor n=1 Tax=Thermocoleostomius sinensis A174 TaxID=2016057 RepID=A0A9E9CA33_9CYAN|nr:response regulator transcription factor [Thermocoleostomius sinensis]WAL62343.1 response regulator transcription factor [Thermocoleostomius sinensis A174]